MARKGYGRNSTLVNITTHADDGTSPVGSNEWNENPNTDGILGLTKSTQAISSNDIDVTDSYIEVTNIGDIYTLSAVTTSLSATNYASDTTSSISEGDLIYVVKAFGLGTTRLAHQNGGAGAGKITTLTGDWKELSATVPTILMARTIGSVLEWVEYGGGAVADSSITSTKILNGTILNEDINASAGIELSKLASDPLARANHTGSQAASTITNFATEVGNTTAVAANTAKTGITSGQASDIASNKTLLGAIAGTATASKALIVDASKDLTGINDLTIAGDLTVSGTSTTVNVENLTVDTADITIMNGNTIAASADDSGIKTQIGASSFKTLLWKHATSAWTSSDNIDSTAYKIAGTTVLSGTTLGSTITGSSLTSVGELTSGVLTGATGTATGLTAGNATLAAGLSAVLADNRMPDLTGEVTTSEGAVATVIVDDIIDEANLKVDVAPTNDYVLTAKSSAAGGLTWAAGGGGDEATTVLQAIGYSALNTSPATEGTHKVSIFAKTIDSNNQGLYVRVKKNGAYVDVQIA